jgi:hypothetical protein
MQADAKTEEEGHVAKKPEPEIGRAASMFYLLTALLGVFLWAGSSDEAFVITKWVGRAMFFLSVIGFFSFFFGGKRAINFADQSWLFGGCVMGLIGLVSSGIGGLFGGFIMGALFARPIGWLIGSIVDRFERGSGNAPVLGGEQRIRSQRFSGYDLPLMRTNHVGELPTEGKRVVIVSAVNYVLHFRVFDDESNMIVDVDESSMSSSMPEYIDVTARRLVNLWPLLQPTAGERERVIDAVESLIGNAEKDKEATSGNGS